MALYKEDLDMMKCDCGMPACEGRVFFHSGCHLKEPTWCEYYDGVLKITCAVCGKEIISIAVAERPIGG